MIKLIYFYFKINLLYKSIHKYNFGFMQFYLKITKENISYVNTSIDWANIFIYESIIQEAQSIFYLKYKSIYFYINSDNF